LAGASKSDSSLTTSLRLFLALHYIKMRYIKREEFRFNKQKQKKEVHSGAIM
jgi:hypothetical protein